MNQNDKKYSFGEVGLWFFFSCPVPVFRSVCVGCLQGLQGRHGAGGLVYGRIGVALNHSGGCVGDG